MAILEGAIIGAVAGLVGVYTVNNAKKKKYNSIKNSISEPGVEYSELFYMATSSRYKKALKFYDSYGALYLTGNTLNYKPNSGQPLSFNLKECKLQEEPKWKMLNWFSITTPGGEKYYFDTYKQGFLTNNSDETIKALHLFQSKAKS
jgi:hypothetical protein